jgi:hypothetical protein
VSPWLHEGDAPQPGGRKPLLAQARRVAARWLSRPSEHAFIAPDAVWHYGAASAGLPRAPQPFADLPAWLAAHAGVSVHAVLSSRCSKSLLLDAGADGVAADDSTGLGTLARARLMQVWGDAAVDWPLRTWSGRRRHGACAWADAQAVRWLADAQEAGVRVRSLQPWWSVALGRVIAEQPQWGRDERSALLVCEA